MRLLAKMSLFGVLGGAVIGGVIFLAVYGIVIDPDAEVGKQAGDAVVKGAAAIIIAVIALLRAGGGGSQ